MKTLYLIDGAAGTGKSDLVNYITTKKKRVATLIPKYTTRKQRTEESAAQGSDLIFPCDTQKKFNSRKDEDGFFWYTYGTRGDHQSYGFYMADIRSALRTHDHALMIVRDIETIQEIKESLIDIRCISVFVYTDRDLVEKRLRSEGYSDEGIDFRLGRQPLAWSDYLKNSGSTRNRVG